MPQKILFHPPNTELHIEGFRFHPRIDRITTKVKHMILWFELRHIDLLFLLHRLHRYMLLGFLQYAYWKVQLIYQSAEEFLLFDILQMGVL